MTFPNLFLVGAQKAGTTALAAWLAASRDVAASPIKEPFWLSADLPWERQPWLQRWVERERRGAPRVRAGRWPTYHFLPTEASYLRLFSDAEAKYRLDASTRNLPSAVAAEAIARRSPDARIVAVLRDPVERAHSSYRMFRSLGRAWRSFDDLVDRELAGRAPWPEQGLGLVALGLYRKQLARYYAAFRAEQLLVLDHRQLARDPAVLAHRVVTFLDIRPAETGELARVRNRVADPRAPRLNTALTVAQVAARVRLVPRNPRRRWWRWYWRDRRPEPMSASVRARLQDHFRPDLIALREDLGWQPAEWLT